MITFKCVIVLSKRLCEKKTRENKKFIELKILTLFYYCHDTDVEGKKSTVEWFFSPLEPFRLPFRSKWSAKSIVYKNNQGKTRETMKYKFLENIVCLK